MLVDHAVWIIADDAYAVGEIVWFFAGKEFLSIVSRSCCVRFLEQTFHKVMAYSSCD